MDNYEHHLALLERSVIVGGHHL